MSGRTRWLIVGMFALLVGLSFFTRHIAGNVLLGTSYNALDFNLAAVSAKNPGSFNFQPSNLLWDETFGYARYTQQVRRGDWFGNTFQAYAPYAADGSEVQNAAHYPFFFDRGGMFALALLSQVTRDVSRAFALADMILPLLIALCAVLFCLQLRPSLPFALLASACFVWFNWSDTATWLSVLRDGSPADGMLLARTPYPQLAMVTFLLFGIVFVRAMRTPNVWWALGLALMLVLNALTYIYSWILALAVTGVPLLLFVLHKPLALKVERNFVFVCLGALAAGMILSAPIWGAYLLSPEIARDVVTRFAEEPVNTPDLLTRTAVLIVLAVPLFLPWLKNMSSRVFWLAFWIGGIAAYNQHLVTGIMVQPGHYPPYYFGTFAMIYLIDLGLAVWERAAPTSFKNASGKALAVVAALVVLGGFAAITWRMVSLARAQADFNRTNVNMMELVTTLNKVDGDYAVLTTDDYLHRLLPGYVKQRFVLPNFTDPMTNAEVETLQNAAARLMGYADWKAWEDNKPAPEANGALNGGEWSFDPDKVIFVVNRHRPNRAPTRFAETLLTNEDFIVGIAPLPKVVEDFYCEQVLSWKIEVSLIMEIMKVMQDIVRIVMDFSTELLERAHYWMRFTRAFDDRLTALFKQGKLVGGLFSQIGHEAISVGAALALDKDDVIAPLHRDIGAYFVRGMTPARMMSQYMGRETGPSRGRDVNLHGCGDLSLGIVGFVSHLPQALPVAVGVAHAFKLKGEPRVAMNFFGDGASSEGLVHEALNWASVFQVPMVFVVENNQYAYSTPLERQMRVENVADRASGYAMPSNVIDGNDFFQVHEAVKQAVEHARKGGGPSLVECKTMRMRGHAIHDNMSYVPKELLAEMEARDPIVRFEMRLREMALLDDEKLKVLMARVDRDLDGAQNFAENAPLPDPTVLTEGIYAE